MARPSSASTQACPKTDFSLDRLGELFQCVSHEFPSSRTVFVDRCNLREATANKFSRNIDSIVDSYGTIITTCTTFKRDLLDNTYDLVDSDPKCRDIENLIIKKPSMIECGALENLRAAINEVTALLGSFSAQMTKNQIAFETAVKALHLKLLGMQDDVQLRAHINEIHDIKDKIVYINAVVSRQNIRPATHVAVMRLEGELLLGKLRREQVLIDGVIADVGSLRGCFSDAAVNLDALSTGRHSYPAGTNLDQLRQTNLDRLLAGWSDLLEVVEGKMVPNICESLTATAGSPGHLSAP